MMADRVDQLVDRVGSLVKDLSLLAESEQLLPQRMVVDVGSFTRDFFAKIRVLPGHQWVLGTFAPGSVGLDTDGRRLSSSGPGKVSLTTCERQP